ncbi:MAG TPA: beta-L-arabinofuranosidase domain-containing protein [bacterium]|nr:beta-L-arabinofuranosidase domain-containing protein [bacterium]
MARDVTEAAGSVDARRSPGAVLRTLDARAVALDGGLWSARQSVNRDRALPHGLRMLEASGNLDNLRIAAGRSTGQYRGPVFMDSDVYKWLEAAAYEVARAPSHTLAGAMAPVIDLIAATQRDDGYVNSYYQVVEPGRRWTDFGYGHELYCAGHLFQAAVAHHRATGGVRLLGVARRFADYLCATFGPDRRVGVPGHPEVEMALVELYRQTGERAYLDLAEFFVDQRGRGWLGPGRYNSPAHYQDRVPVREAVELEGHAVRAQYLTAGVTDLYLETGERALLDAVKREWDDLVNYKLYVTGAVGSRHLAESVGQPYELPNELAYGETCAAIAGFMWSWRMLLATGEGRFADLMERMLYNAILSGVSLDGERYFYVNPLASNGREEHLSRTRPRRQEWHRVACCPPNVMRLFASLGHYVATRNGSGLQIHQYAAARISAKFGSGRFAALRIDSAYPWEGRVRLTIEEGDGKHWQLNLRVPAWAGAAAVRVNGAAVDASPSPAGYLRLDEPWTRGDVVEVDWPLTPRFVEAHPWIESARGCVAIERGPVVYCLEQADHPLASVADLEIDTTAPMTCDWIPDLLGGVAVIRGSAAALDTSSWRGRLYQSVGANPAPVRRSVDFVAVPYYAWANREPGAMRVWVPRFACGT